MYNKICYLNKFFVPLSKAKVSVFDRGFNFADGVYEVIAIVNHVPIHFEQHLKRLARSLAEIHINYVINVKKLEIIFKRLITINNIKNGAIYLQITRGTNFRKHEFPKETLPTIFITAYNTLLLLEPVPSKAITTQDLRWKRCDIKSISLLPNIIAKNHAHLNGAREAILIDNDIVLEGSTSNLFIVDKNRVIKTHPDNNKILPGITRQIIIELLANTDFKVKIEPFTIEDLYSAQEVFITGTLAQLIPIVEVDNKIINDRQIGPIFKHLYSLYKQYRNQYITSYLAT